jgi:hypothetical protein
VDSRVEFGISVGMWMFDRETSWGVSRHGVTRYRIERCDREKDVRMCPRCFGGYFINLWCDDLAAHQSQTKEFQVKNMCPDCGYFSANWTDYPQANEKLKEQKLRSRIPYLKCHTILNNQFSVLLNMLY